MFAKVSKERKFLYSRIAILVASAVCIAAALAGWYGFPFWHGPFIFCVFLVFGLFNYPHRTPLSMFIHRRLLFLIFYAALATSFLLVDHLALRLYLWFYPFYHGPSLILLYGVAYPFAALAGLELFYALTNLVEEPLTFEKRHAALAHQAVHAGEGIFFLSMVFLVVLGATGYYLSFPALLVAAFFWAFLVFLKFGTHIKHPAHLVLLFALITGIAALLYRFSGVTPFEWTYVEGVAFGMLPVGSFFLVWFGTLWFTLFTLRLWNFLVLHPQAK